MKKCKVAGALGETLDLADTLKVCAVCWTAHPEGVCPEANAFMKAFLHLNSGSPLSVADQPQTVPTVEEDGNVDMGTGSIAATVGESPTVNDAHAADAEMPPAQDPTPDTFPAKGSNSIPKGGSNSQEAPRT